MLIYINVQWQRVEKYFGVGHIAGETNAQGYFVFSWNPTNPLTASGPTYDEHKTPSFVTR
jgi:hypothetical protein